MTEHNLHTAEDTPGDWEKYHALLAKQPALPMPESSLAMMSRIDAAIDHRPGALRRWAAAPAVALATLMVVFWFGISGTPSGNSGPVVPAGISTRTSTQAPRLVHRPRRRLQQPTLPDVDESETPNTDTAVMPQRYEPQIPQKDPGPGDIHFVSPGPGHDLRFAP
ncbi:MAG: hypothetical protein ABI876_17455 [Bacteroidota bacterium]